MYVQNIREWKCLAERWVAVRQERENGNKNENQESRASSILDPTTLPFSSFTLTSNLRTRLTHTCRAARLQMPILKLAELQGRPPFITLLGQRRHVLKRSRTRGWLVRRRAWWLLGLLGRLGSFQLGAMCCLAVFSPFSFVWPGTKGGRLPLGFSFLSSGPWAIRPLCADCCCECGTPLPRRARGPVRRRWRLARLLSGRAPDSVGDEEAAPRCADVSHPPTPRYRPPTSARAKSHLGNTPDTMLRQQAGGSPSVSGSLNGLILS